MIALAAGVSVGLGCGDNTMAALITRELPKLPDLELRWEDVWKRLQDCQVSVI